MAVTNHSSATTSQSTTSPSSLFVPWHWRHHLSSINPPCTRTSPWKWLRLRFTHRHMVSRRHHRMAYTNSSSHLRLSSWHLPAINRLVVSRHQSGLHQVQPFTRPKINSMPPIMAGCTTRIQQSCRMRTVGVMGKIVAFSTAQLKSSNLRLLNINTPSNKSPIVNQCEVVLLDKNCRCSSRQLRLIKISITSCDR